MNAHCASGNFLVACLSECPQTLLSVAGFLPVAAGFWSCPICVCGLAQVCFWSQLRREWLGVALDCLSCSLPCAGVERISVWCAVAWCGCVPVLGLSTVASPLYNTFGSQLKQGDPPNLSILLSGGKETNKDSLSKGD